jgi:hypothetical protein
MPVKSSKSVRSTATKVTPKKVTKTSEVQKPDVKLISMNEYWNDLKNRTAIHQYEWSMAVKDMKKTISLFDTYRQQLVSEFNLNK